MRRGISAARSTARTATAPVRANAPAQQALRVALRALGPSRRKVRGCPRCLRKQEKGQAAIGPVPPAPKRTVKPQKAAGPEQKDINKRKWQQQNPTAYRDPAQDVQIGWLFHRYPRKYWPVSPHTFKRWLEQSKAHPAAP